MKRRLIWTAGKNGGPIRASTAPPNGRSRRCSPKNARRCLRCPSNHSAITSTANEPCIWTDVSKSKPHTMAHLRAGSADVFGCSGMHLMFVSSTRSPDNCCVSTCENSAGTHIGALCQSMHRNHGETAVRRILGVLALAKKYGIASTDEACALGLEAGAEYHFVRRYLERNPQLPLSLRQIDPLIRQLTLYRDLIEKRTGTEKQP